MAQVLLRITQSAPEPPALKGDLSSFKKSLDSLGGRLVQGPARRADVLRMTQLQSHPAI